ncbi:MAG: VOC family protein [Microbacterium sp.]
MTDELRTYPTGVPCWIQNETSDPSAAAVFYGGLFGWTYSAVDSADPTSYLFARLDGQDAGAIARADDRGWVSFIACDDIDEACARVARLGGRVIDEPDAGTPFGRSATCADPQGAIFRLWQAGSHPGSQIVNTPGAWNFSDLHTPDPSASLDFYGGVFGWRVDDELGAGMIRLPGYGDHLEATVDPDIRERQAFAPEGFADVIAGITSDRDAAWWIRFTVADRDESAARAVELGGVVESSTETDWTREAVVRDPQGARFIVSQLAPPE